MEWPGRLMRRLRLLIRRGGAERAMDDELRYHIECETKARIQSGMSPQAARLGALRDFGGVERFKEDARDARGIRSLEDLITDTRYAARVLRRNPGFTACAILTFALGIGAAGAIFSVVYGVLLRPLPYVEPDRLVVLWERNVPHNLDTNVVSIGNFEAWRDKAQAFDGMAALVPRPVTLADEVSPERIMGAEVSPGYFRLLGVSPALGRDFEPADGEHGRTATVILSHDFWTRRYGGDAAVIGRTLPMAGVSCTIIGVMPAGFAPPRFGWLQTQELWFPFVATPENRAWGRFLLVVARRRPDVSLDRARAEMAVLGDRLAAEVPDDHGWTVSVIPLAEQITGDVRAAFRVLLGAVGLMLLIAVANVATLTMTLMRRRAAELAIRRSLGATDRRLFRQLFTQSALLGLIGAAVALLGVSPVVRLLISLAPADIPRLESIRVDALVVGVTTAVAVLATIGFGAVAAVRGTSDAALFSQAKTAGDSRTSAPAAGVSLVAAEIAVALALSIMAMLMARSFYGLRAVDLGFTADGVAAARVALTGPRSDSPAATGVFFEALLERVRALPGVQAAGFMSTRPFWGLGPATEVTDPRRPHDATTLSVVTDIRYVNATLFTTLQIPVRHGTLFDADDTLTGPIHVIVSESLAKAIWPTEDPLGRELHLDLYDGLTAKVIAVVADLHLMDPRTPVRPAAYLSDARFPSDTRDLIVRVSGDPQAIVPSLRGVLKTLAPGVPLYQITALSRLIDAAVAADRFTTFLLSAFATIAVVLGGIGVFGVISGEVARRRKEIGLRMALGASRSTVTRLMLRQTIGRALAGVIAGSVLALWLARSMTSLLFGVGPADPASYVTVVMVIVGLATIGTLIPVVQATRIDPSQVLRAE